MRRKIEVIIGVVFSGGRILISQRHAADSLGGFWEFPGGKLERGESHHQCLSRELREELDIAVRVIEALPIIEFDYASGSICLHPYLCEHVGGQPKSLASQQIAQILPADLTRYRFPPANAELIRSLIARFAGAGDAT